MIHLIELATMLLLGFVLGRIWQIRQQLLLNVYVQRRLDENGTARRERLEAPDLKSSMVPDLRSNDFPVASPPTLHFHANPAAFAGRFHALHQSLQQVRASSV